MLPGIPGFVLPPEDAAQLQDQVSQLCNVDHRRFPGSQPVSFASSHLAKLEQEDFWVCEKSDGVRVLMFIRCVGSGHDVFLIDRKNVYRAQQQGFVFPHYEDKQKQMGDCILDGELVLDIMPGGNEILRYLVFDCLVIDRQNVMDKTLDSRYGRLQQFFFKPYRAMLSDFPQMADNAPYQLVLKPMEKAYAIETVLAQNHKLLHGTDGFIYTSVRSRYIPRTDEGILKWKPPHENSVDFKLELRFPELGDTGRPDFEQTPLFLLYVWEGAKRYSFYDTLTVDENEWETMKRSKVQYDDRIIEARWDFDREAWRFMRIRDDKSDGNHKDIVEKVVQTILDPVSQSDLIARCPSIRNAWKAREAAGPIPNARPTVRPPPYNFPMPTLPYPTAPYWQGATVGYGFAKVIGAPTVDGWKR